MAVVEPSPPRRTTVLFWSVALAVSTIRLVLALGGWPETSLVADDAFYYFTIAHNVAEGNGPTFDGQAITNGFHPLWQVVLVPIFAVFRSDLWAPVRAALSLAVVLDLLSGLLLWRLTSRVSGPTVGAIMGTLWFLSPFTFLLGLQGMETSLNTLLILLLLDRLLVLAHRDDPLRLRHAIGVGLLLGLCGLARTDNLITVGGAMVVVVFTVFSRRSASRSRPFAWVGVAGLAAALVTAPWFLWNWSRFGSLVQVSGLVKYHTHRIHGALPSDWGSTFEALRTVAHALFVPVLRPIHALAGGLFTDPRISTTLSVAILVPALVIFGVGMASVLRHDRARLAFLVFPLTYGMAHAALFGIVWRAYASWYALPFLACMLFAFGAFAPGLAKTSGRVRALVMTCAAVIVAASLSGYPINFTRKPHGPRGPEIQWSPILQQIQQALPQGAVAGAWDAGAAGYVATRFEGITVVNLDCLVNNVAFEAVRRGRYFEYLTENVDVYLQPRSRARMFLDRDEVDRLERWGRSP